MFVAIVLLINLFISFWNAKVTGRIWHDAKAVGGWTYVLAWSGAIQSALGFTMVYVFLMGIAGVIAGAISESTGILLANLVYALIILPIIGTGLVITIESWIRVARDRSLLNIGAASYNTLATAYNIYSAVNSLPKAWDSIMEKVNTDDDFDLDSDLAKAIAVVAIALFGGILSTTMIMRKYMGTLPLPPKN